MLYAQYDAGLFGCSPDRPPKKHLPLEDVAIFENFLELLRRPTAPDKQNLNTTISKTKALGTHQPLPES